MVAMLVPEGDDVKRFERLFLPHLGAAYNLACWLTGNEANARDIVQDSCLRAFRALPQFQEEAPRAWLLTIVRNQCYTSLRKSSVENIYVKSSGDMSALEETSISTVHYDNPETILMQVEERESVRQAMNELPVAYREVVVLKELEEMSYAEIAVVTGTPIGTVMSRISRGRHLLKQILTKAHANAT